MRVVEWFAPVTTLAMECMSVITAHLSRYVGFGIFGCSLWRSGADGKCQQSTVFVSLAGGNRVDRNTEGREN